MARMTIMELIQNFSGKPRRREDNIKLDTGTTCCAGRKWFRFRIRFGISSDGAPSSATTVLVS